MRVGERLVLLVDDNEASLTLARSALHETAPDTRVEFARDGEAALARLRDAASPLPDLVVLDLLLPRLDGWGVLFAMRQDPRLAHVPVIILTTSASTLDGRTAALMGAHAFHTKPATLADFHALALALSTQPSAPFDRIPKEAA